jgi:hypothetical protein
MRRILLGCGASLVIYMTAFAFILDRPLTLGALRGHIDASLRLSQTIERPKLVILAGSNGPYSHRCETIEPIVGRPCINAGTAVGVGLDYLFARWKPELRPGDIVYLPLEEAQYVRPRATSDLGPDAAIMLRHDRTTLGLLSPQRQIAALFASGPREAIMSLIEMSLEADGFHDPRTEATGGTNHWGDHIGHTKDLSALNQASLLTIMPYHPSAAQIEAGYGTALVARFVEWAGVNGVRVVGGLPTGFDDSPISGASIAAIRAIFRGHGGFLELANHSRYPRAAFFDTQDHLNEGAQIAHSVLVANALLQFMDRTPAASP